MSLDTVRVFVRATESRTVAGSYWTAGFEGEVSVTADQAAELEKAGMAVARPGTPAAQVQKPNEDKK